MSTLNCYEKRIEEIVRPKCVLKWGIHNGTMMSRDDGEPKVVENRDM